MIEVVRYLFLRLVLLAVVVHAVFNAGYDAGVAQTEAFYEDSGWDEPEEGTTAT
ncbi:MAG: hypothetical protein ACREXP_00500 [Steroidobacteraceae bacterium]